MSPAEPFERLLVCYVPALDLRRVAAGAFPHVASLLAQAPSVRFRAQPTTDQLATMLTGTYPHEHGLWGPRLKADWRIRTPAEALIDRLPDLVTTSAQGALHLALGPLDLATMPPRRRRRFDWLRFNLKHARDVAKTGRPISGLATPFTILAGRPGRYVYHDDYWDLDGLLARTANGDHVLEMIDVHCLDHLQHWRMSERECMAGFYRGIDRFVAAMYAKCRQKGIGFVLLSDHGMEPIERTMDLVGELRALSVSAADYDLFVENSKATFWFHDHGARAAITAYLADHDDCVLLDYEELARYAVRLPDNRYGDAYCYARPGITFFPNDFHQPLASLIMTLTDRQQRKRLRVPWHQADHGYLSENDSEIGIMALIEDGYDAEPGEVELIDIAPTLLALLGHKPAPTMRGRSVLQRRGTP